MNEVSTDTKVKILESARKEFLEKGFMNASLRTIAANAGVTTGAMYRHFSDKNALFCALVDDAIDFTVQTVMKADVFHHADVEDAVSKEHFAREKETTNELITYIFNNTDSFKLLLTKASGSTHEHFQEEICDLYTKNCTQTFNWMYKSKVATKKIDRMTIHFIASTVINAFTEIITHDMTKKAAFQYIENIEEFTRYGMIHMLCIPCDEHE